MSDKRAEQRGGADSGELPAAALHGADSLRDQPGNRAEAVLAGISDGIAAFDNDWRLVYGNPAVGRLLGRDITSLIGRTLDQLLDLPADDPFGLAYRDSKRAGEQLTFTKYSEIFSSWIDVRGYPHPVGYVILFRLQGASGPVSQDLLDSERQREVIRSINQRIFDTSLDLILVVDRRGDVLRVSPSSRAILGFAPEELRSMGRPSSIRPILKARATICGWRATAASRAISNAATSTKTATPYRSHGPACGRNRTDSIFSLAAT
jgi:PAS domain-containing protein